MNIGTECETCEAGVYNADMECENCGIKRPAPKPGVKSGNLYRQMELLRLTVEEIAERLDNLEKRVQNDIQILVKSNFDHGYSIESIIRAFERHERAHKVDAGDVYDISRIGA